MGVFGYRWPFAAIAAVALVGCATPDLPPPPVTAGAVAPDLVPLGPLLARVDAAPVQDAVAIGAALDERAARLRDRAARLGDPVDAADRSRLDAALSRRSAAALASPPPTR